MSSSVGSTVAAPSGAATRKLSSFLATRPRLRLALFLSAPLTWLVAVYIVALAALLVTALWSVDSFTGEINRALTLDNLKEIVTDALLIGVDLGPNLSVTGSLATILWLQAIRREGEDVSFLAFLKVGAVAMPLALLAALGVRLLIG